MIDVVYILGTGSPWHNNELRYSLRSVERYLKEYRNIYLIGERPDWISENVIHIPFKENSSLARERRIMEKISFACHQEEISEKFLFFNDDYFLISKMEANVPDYHNGTITQAIERRLYKDEYRSAMKNTEKVAPGNHFDIHYPIIYDKDKFLHAMKQHDWEKKNGYIVKSLYCNTLGIKGEPIQDLKINKKLTRGRIIGLIENRDMFSIGDRALNSFMKDILNELYPKKSKYEL